MERAGLEMASSQPCLETASMDRKDEDAPTAQLAQAVQIADDDNGILDASSNSVQESFIGPDSSQQFEEGSPDRLEEDEEVRAAITRLNPNEPTPPTRSPGSRIKFLSPAPESWSTAANPPPRPPLSSAALAALAESLPSTPPPPPVRPPKSAARQRTLSFHSPPPGAVAANMSEDLGTNRDQPAAPPHPDGEIGVSPVMESSAPTTATTPTLGGGGGGALSQSRPRPQLETTTTTARMSTASSSAGSSPFPSGRRSGAFYTDESDWTGGGHGGGPSSSIAALETPATTVNFGASPSSSPAAVVDSAWHRSRPLGVETVPPPSAELAGLGLDFLASKPILPALDSEVAPRTSFDYADLDRGVERISQFAKTLPSPVPTVPAQSPFGPVTSQSSAPPAAVGGPPKMTMTSGGASDPSSPAASPAERTLPLPRLGTSTTGTSPPQQDSSLERLTSPAPSLHGRLAAFESETDFFSTDVQTDADADGDGDGDGDYDEREDSFNLYPNGLDGRRRRRRERSASSSWGDPPSLRFQGPSPQLELDSFALLAAGKNGGGHSAGLWNEDVPNWEGALPRPGDGVVDWTECRLQRQALPSNTTHLILARCQTPLQIAPLLTTSISSLSQTLVVLDIGSCGLTEIPTAIGACCFLEELDIHGNPLATGVLPPFLGTLPALNVLLADDCNIASLPDSLAQLTRLHTLTLRNNRLRTLPTWISRLSALEQLLIDGNPFHWQIHNLVRPLLLHSPATAADAAVSLPNSRQRSHSVLSPPAAPVRTESSPILTSLSTLGTLATSGAVSPPLASPTMFRSAAGSPVPDEQLATPTRARAETFGGAPIPIPQHDDSPGDAKDKRKWGRLLKKVSTGRLRSASSASKRAAAPSNRTVSQPVTRDEESDAEQGTMSRIGMFGGNSGSSSRSRTKSRPRTNKRQSFLALKASGGAELLSTMTASQPAALEAVLSYLRDLDDLSPDLSLPTIPLDASSPALRHSPSLGALSPGGSYARSPSPGSLRRAQSSSRRVPSTGSSAHRGSHASSFEDAALPVGDVSGTATEEAVLPRADDPVKRAAVIDEIISTEKSYLRGLQELCSIYVASAAAATAPSASSTGGKRDTVVPAIERRAVFGNVEAIRDFHAKILLPDLLAAGESSADSRVVADEIGNVFSSHVSFMKIYSSYINGFDDALARIQSWAKPTPSRSPLLPGPISPAIGGIASYSYDAAAGIQSTLSSSQKKRIKSWLKRCRSHASHSQISLESYLLLPIQRIPRYRMLLGTLASCTPIGDDNSGSTLAQAVRDLEDIALMLNESKRENEGRAQLVMWQNRLVSKFKSPLVQPHRTLLRSGALTLVRSVKRTTMQLEPPLPGTGTVDDGADEQVFTLYTEAKEMSLTGLLCNDLLVLVKMPPPPLDSDPNSPVELYTVLRLTGGRSALQGGHHRAKPPASVDGVDDLLRLKIGDKAVCYFRCAADPYKNRKEAHAWANAVNLQWEVNT